MPTYDYQCSAGHNFEKINKMSESPRVKCPICGKPATRQISGGAGLVFKGTGFYITDYGKDGKGARKADAGGSSEVSAAKPDSGAPMRLPNPAAARRRRPSERGSSGSLGPRGC
jgi:putative FmdB family regulatory protein